MTFERSRDDAPGHAGSWDQHDRPYRGAALDGFGGAPVPAAPAAPAAPGHDHPILRKATAALREPAAPDASFTEATTGAGGEVPYRRDMEQSFGQDFSGVQAYTGRAAALDGISAEAATRGEQVAFGTGAPSRELVAHELTHVVQGRQGGGATGVNKKDALSQPTDAAEVEADAVAEQAARGDRVTVGATLGGALSLKGKANATGKGKFALLTKNVTPTGIVITDIDSLDELELRISQGGNVTVLGRDGKEVKIPAALIDPGSFEVDDSKDDKHDEPKTTGVKHFTDVNSAFKTVTGREGAIKETSGEKNPDEDGGTTNSCFSRPVATGSDGSDVTVQMDLHTNNKYDRVAYKVAYIDGKGRRGGTSKRAWWNNPAWDPDAMGERYKFKTGFKGLSADGDGTLGVKRTITAKIPIAELKEYFGKKLSESSRVCFGMEVFYGNAPAAADKNEAKGAFDVRTDIAHQYGLGATSSPEANGDVDLRPVKDALGLKEGSWVDDEDVWKLPLPESPGPNVLRDFPKDYKNKSEGFKKLAPKEGEGTGKLATRIENEATLKLSSGAKLQDAINLLTQNFGTFDTVMHAGSDVLKDYEWTLGAEGKPMVFTDFYMDDPDLHALLSGVGIRKRTSSTATKLNVKTGEGHQVGELGKDGKEGDKKSDVFRRHEIGFDINKESTGKDIGQYLSSGVGKDNSSPDQWNKAGQQANLTAMEKIGKTIDFSKLQEKMVLQGHRTKFKLRAEKEINGKKVPINIELSCDHTVGRTYQNFKSDKTEPDEVFKDLEGKYKHIYDIEMELEHLGAKAPEPEDTGETTKVEGETTKVENQGVETVGDKVGGNETVKDTKKDEIEHEPEKMIRPDHPGRMYMRDDTKDSKFNTPSFQVFFDAHNRLISWLRESLGKDELGQDKQKLESMRDLLFPNGKDDVPKDEDKQETIVENVKEKDQHEDTVEQLVKDKVDDKEKQTGGLDTVESELGKQTKPLELDDKLGVQTVDEDTETTKETPKETPKTTPKWTPRPRVPKELVTKETETVGSGKQKLSPKDVMKLLGIENQVNFLEYRKFKREHLGEYDFTE